MIVVQNKIYSNLHDKYYIKIIGYDFIYIPDIIFAITHCFYDNCKNEKLLLL